MADNSFADWVKPIARSDYAHMVAEPIAVEPGKRLMLETKDSVSLTGHSLRAKVRMTFSGLTTKNKAIYLPDEMFRGARSFVSPFNKPVLKHHDEGKDPIGRVIDVRYIDTTNQAILVDSRVQSAMSPFRDAKTTKKNRLKSVPLFQELSSTDGYRGVGHIQGLWNITDPDAIQKVLDGRYLTVSTSFMPKGAHCSTCALDGELVDWRNEDCGHDRGRFYDGKECVAVPFGFDYEEVSPVNNPAAPHAQILEFGENLSFADASSGLQTLMTHQIFSGHVLVKKSEDGTSKGYRISDATEVEIPTSLNAKGEGKEQDALQEDSKNQQSSPSVPPENPAEEKADAVIGRNEQREEVSSQGNTMNFADLTKDTESNYQEILKFLPSDAARLTGDLLTGLEDSVFIGPNKTFPAKDIAHCEAIKGLLETVEDSDAKATLLEILDEKLVKLAPTPEEPEADSAAVPEPEAAAEEEKVSDKVEISEEELTALKEKAAKTDDLTATRDMLKLRVTSLKDEISQLEAANIELMKDQKQMLAETLVDAQIKKGLRVTDRTEKLTELSTRSIQSLRDSLSDLESEPENGMARKPDGEKLDGLGAEQDSAAPEREEVDTSAYAAILDRYYEKSIGPGGQRAADMFLVEQKRRGYLPAHINP
jgi:hypothetical protein